MQHTGNVPTSHWSRHTAQRFNGVKGKQPLSSAWEVLAFCRLIKLKMSPAIESERVSHTLVPRIFDHHQIP